MWQTVQQFLLQTPIWVYVVLALLIFRGIKACQTRIVALRKLFIIPAIFMVLSLHTLLTTYILNADLISTWALGIAIGSGIGWLINHAKDIKVDGQQQLFLIPGSAMTLILVLLIFVSKYYFGYQITVSPEETHQINFAITLIAISGVCSGLFIGRLINYLYRLKKGPFVSLNTNFPLH